jgi:hypothetical protein
MAEIFQKAAKTGFWSQIFKNLDFSKKKKITFCSAFKYKQIMEELFLKYSKMAA